MFSRNVYGSVRSQQSGYMIPRSRSQGRDLRSDQGSTMSSIMSSRPRTADTERGRTSHYDQPGAAVEDNISRDSGNDTYEDTYETEQNILQLEMRENLSIFHQYWLNSLNLAFDNLLSFVNMISN